MKTTPETEEKRWREITGEHRRWSEDTREAGEGCRAGVGIVLEGVLHVRAGREQEFGRDA